MVKSQTIKTRYYNDGDGTRDISKNIAKKQKFKGSQEIKTKGLEKAVEAGTK